MEPQLYGSLIAKIDGELLLEQTAIDVRQSVDTRVIVEIRAATPLKGLEFKPVIGRRMRLSVHLIAGHDIRTVSGPLFEADVTIVATELQGVSFEPAIVGFTCRCDEEITGPG